MKKIMKKVTGRD